MKGIFKITEHYSVGTVRNYPSVRITKEPLEQEREAWVIKVITVEEKLRYDNSLSTAGPKDPSTDKQRSPQIAKISNTKRFLFHENVHQYS